jgi:AsmA protein
MPRAAEPSIPANDKSRRRRRKRWIALVFVAVVMSLGAAIAPWTFSSKALYEEISGQIKRSAGLFVATEEPASLTLLPRPHITFNRVFLADPAESVTIHAEKLRGNLNLLRLLTGRLELSEIALTSPAIVVDLDRAPIEPMGATARAAAAQPSSPEAMKADQEALGSLYISGGRATLRKNGKAQDISNIEGALNWPKVGSAATFAGNFTWRGERFRALLWVARPGELLRDQISPVTARLDSPSLNVEAEGFGQAGAKPRFNGRISASTPSVRQALNLLELQTALPAPIEHVQLAAQASAGLHELQLTNLRLFASDNELQGSLMLRQEDYRMIVQGDLSSNFLSIRPLTVDLPPMTNSDGQWSRDALDLPSIDTADVDLHVTATHARLGRLSLDDAGLSLALHSGRLEISLDQGKAYRGELKGRAVFTIRSGEGLECHITGQTSGVDAGLFGWDAAENSHISASLDSSVSLNGVGDSVAQIMRNLDGRATLTLTQGAIDGINLERALRRLDKSPLSSAIDIRSGRTSFDRAGATFQIEKGVAAVEDGFARGPGFSLSFSGSTRIADRSLAIKAIAIEADSAGKPRDKGLQIGFDIKGSWDDLNFSPDAQSFIRRSDAAAPLLPNTEPPSGGSAPSPEK